ncbi:hypothetical protein JCM6882_006622 [Rhodosporidiobolus microsporus]
MPSPSAPLATLSSPFLSLLLLLFALLFLAEQAQAQATISSPASVTECLPQQLTISGGEPPYTITVLPGGSTGGEPLETLPTLEEAGTVRWVADIPAGQDITFAVRDNTGAVNFSAQVPVLAGSSTDCLGDNASTGSATTTTGSESATVSGSTTTSGTDSESESETSSSASASTSGSASRTTSTSTGSGTTSRTTSAASASATETGGNNGAAVVEGKNILLPAALLLVSAFA